MKKKNLLQSTYQDPRLASRSALSLSLCLSFYYCICLSISFSISDFAGSRWPKILHLLLLQSLRLQPPTRSFQGTNRKTGTSCARNQIGTHNGLNDPPSLTLLVVDHRHVNIGRNNRRLSNRKMQSQTNWSAYRRLRGQANKSHKSMRVNRMIRSQLVETSLDRVMIRDTNIFFVNGNRPTCISFIQSRNIGDIYKFPPLWPMGLTDKCCKCWLIAKSSGKCLLTCTSLSAAIQRVRACVSMRPRGHTADQR